jgi:hypothetical protein
LKSVVGLLRAALRQLVLRSVNKPFRRKSAHDE